MANGQNLNAAAAGPQRRTLLAFAGVVLLGGGAGVAIKFMLRELDPVFSAGLRFVLAGSLLWVAVLWARHPLPRGRALAGSLLYGVLYFGMGFALTHLGMTEVTAGTTQVMFALAPLIVVLLAALHGVERLSPRALLGAVVAFTGSAAIFYESLGAASLPALGAVMFGVLCSAEAIAVVKRFPAVHPVVHNAIAQTAGAAMLMALSALLGEDWVVPRAGTTLAALGYAALAGSVLFMLLSYVIETWTASAASYTLVVMPAVTVPVAALFLGETISLVFALGCAAIFAGLYIGVLRRPRRR